MHEVQLRVRLEDEDDLATALEVAEGTAELTAEVVADGDPANDGSPDALIEPVTMILIGAGVLAAAQFIKDWWLRTHRGGLVIDQRPGAVDEVHRDKDIDYGWVLVFPSDGGRVQIEIHDAPKEASERLLSDIIAGVFKTASSVAEAAKNTLGDGKVKDESVDA